MSNYFKFKGSIKTTGRLPTGDDLESAMKSVSTRMFREHAEKTAERVRAKLEASPDPTVKSLAAHVKIDQTGGGISVQPSSPDISKEMRKAEFGSQDQRPVAAWRQARRQAQTELPALARAIAKATVDEARKRR